MNHRIAAAAAALGLAAALQTAGQVATTRLSPRPRSAPAAGTPKPVDPAVMAILNRLEGASAKHPRLEADLEYRVDMLQLGDSEQRDGRVYYQGPGKETAAKFRIHFDTLRQGGGPRVADEIDYVFDGAWLTVRKKRIKQMIRYQLAPPGKHVEPLQLGKGPFPMPFGQKTEAVLRHFVPSTRKGVKTDPPKTDYLKLITRPDRQREVNLKWIEMWVARDTGLPVRIVAEDKSENRSTVAFRKIKTPKKFAKATFDLPRPPRDWEYRVEKFKGKLK